MLRFLTLVVVLLSSFNLLAADSSKPNVLFIAVDDLRPELNCYGEEHIHSPNIDRLAKNGVLFERAYCMVPTCGASRASMMTGIRPARNRFVSYLTWAEKDAPGIMTMNTLFKKNGYYTLSLGKVFHHPTDNKEGWSEPAKRPSQKPWYRNPENQALHEERQKIGRKHRGPAWESADVSDEVYTDGRHAQMAIEDLRRLKEKNEPFFLAVGFLKPHLPFIAPKKYWDLYDPDKIHLPENYYVPENAPEISIHKSGELRAYAGIPAKGPVSDETARKLIHGYYACVSYTDAQIGKLLDELDRLNLSENTIVVLWGDHGWNLGEHTLWCKHSCYETSMRIPVIVSAPGFQKGKKSSGLIESIDLYPTLAELAGLSLPSHLQGKSFVPLLKDPEKKWKPVAIGRFGPGDTVRSDRYRYTEYTQKDGKLISRMLYDHDKDPDENRNITRNGPAKPVIPGLSRTLHQTMGETKEIQPGSN